MDMRANTSGLMESREPNADDTPSWLFIVIPVVSALVGYVTNIVALSMTFGPVEFYGWKIWQPEGTPLGLIGWQGIIPSKSKVMAGRLMDLFLDKLLDVHEVFGRVDPYLISRCLGDGVKAVVRQTVSDGLGVVLAGTWWSLPDYVQEETITMLEKDADLFVHLMLHSIKSNILKILDLRQFAERRASENKHVMADIFSKIGRSECRFIELSGLVFGFFFGCIQAVIYYFYRGDWLLPVAGFLVGTLTNLIAVRAIFEPAEPVKYGCFTMQGLFVRRQQAAAAEIAEVAQQEFMRAEFLVDEMINGAKKEEFAKLLDEVVENYIEASQPAYEKLAIFILLGSNGAHVIKSFVAEAVKNNIADIFPACYDVMEECMDMEATLRSRLRDLNPADFVGVLRPAFQEDEIKLIAVGGVLGAFVGALQQYALFQWFE